MKIQTRLWGIVYIILIAMLTIILYCYNPYNYHNGWGENFYYNKALDNIMKDF